MYYFCVFSEEEWKRYYQSLSEGYGAVGFSYDYHNHQHNSEYYQGGYYYKYTFIINLQKKLHSMNFSSVWFSQYEAYFVTTCSFKWSLLKWKPFDKKLVRYVNLHWGHVNLEPF